MGPSQNETKMLGDVEYRFMKILVNGFGTKKKSNIEIKHLDSWMRSRPRLGLKFF